ncbi:uncharacterized protein LOC101858558 [Aplysia californica]|uniref:Uncharacterized protein LOC101858558 n=1 Tax=Aplysia californica TaxID=6500 RepID=A0ABM1A1W7_APLCA|nr:uncharacterized protein LOC101858558 [Aplysia californica]
MTRSPGLLTGALLALLALTRVNGQCEMVDVPDIKGDDISQPTFLPSHTIASCKTECLARTTCLSAELRGGNLCLLFPVDTGTAATGDTLFKKVCTTPTPSACSVSSTNNLDGINPSFPLSLSGSSQTDCEEACKSFVECVAYVYIFNPTECKLMTSTPSTEDGSGSVYGLKKRCSSGSFVANACCFDRSVEVDVPSSASYTSLTDSANSCADVCLAISNCAAVSYNPSGGLCKVFTSSPVTSVSSGVTLYTKSCSSSDPASLTYTDVCQSGSKTVPYPALLVFITMVAWILP